MAIPDKSRDFRTGEFSPEQEREQATGQPVGAMTPWVPEPMQAVPEPPAPQAYTPPGARAAGAQFPSADAYREAGYQVIGVTPRDAESPTTPETPAWLRETPVPETVPGTDVAAPTGQPEWWQEYFELGRQASEMAIERQRQDSMRNLRAQMARRGTLGSSIEADEVRELEADFAAQQAQQEFGLFQNALDVRYKYDRLAQNDKQFLIGALVDVLPALQNLSEEELDAIIPELLAQLGVSADEI